MSEYFFWNKKTISNFEITEINKFFDAGYLFTREHKGSMYQTRALRLNLEHFELSSENRRVLNKIQDLKMEPKSLPLGNDSYDWKIHKLGKDFYKNKLHLEKLFSANKIKELILNQDNSNFNLLMQYSINSNVFGYAICYENIVNLQYAYPFYDYINYPSNYGMGMMLKAINYAQDKALRYIYLGSVTRREDAYKLQFKGLEWFDKDVWHHEKLYELKQILMSK